jgi:hypothetical protein
MGKPTINPEGQASLSDLRFHSPDTAAYYAAVSAEDEKLQAALSAIQDDERDGRLTVREAADARVQVLGHHLERCQQARRTHLGESS